MKPDDSIWVFVGSNAQFPSAVFRQQSDAVAWITKHGVSGTLSVLPVDTGVFEWAVENDVLNLTPEKLPEKSKDPKFIANCLTASLDHFHYVDGKEK